MDKAIRTFASKTDENRYTKIIKNKWIHYFQMRLATLTFVNTTSENLTFINLGIRYTIEIIMLLYFHLILKVL